MTQENLIPEFFNIGESTLLVKFQNLESTYKNLSILKLVDEINNVKMEGFREAVPASCSLIIFYDPLILPLANIVHLIRTLCRSLKDYSYTPRTLSIPVCYHDTIAVDLDEIARYCNLTRQDVIQLHSSALYFVEMMGFLPGFAYLTGLPNELNLPRRPTPRLKVPAGAVAIADNMTAIYPLESPGGWHIIGRTPVRPWDMAHWDEPLLRAGDSVRFYSIDSREAEVLEEKMANGWRPSPTETE